MVTLVVIAVLAVGIGFLVVFVIKSLLQPKQISSISKLIKQQKYAQAEKIAKAIIQKDQNDYLAHYFLGQAYLADNKNELALMEFKFVNQHAVFGQEINEREFRKQISQLYMKFNQTDEALKEFLLLTKLDPNNADNFYNVGKIYEQKNHADLALGFYQKAISLNKKHVKAHAGLGLLLFRAKQIDTAKKEIALAIQLSPETFSTYYYLGKILKEGKDLSGAVKAFEKALRDPEYKQRALLERGSCFMMANKMDNAMSEFDRAIKASKSDKDQETLYARYFLASCYEKQHNLDKAMELWQQIYQVNHSFRDVSQKLSEYKELAANDSMKDFLTCTQDELVEICKNAAMSALGLSVQKSEPKKWGVQMIATEGKSDDWRNMRKQLYLLNFYRETEAIDDGEIRKILDLAKSQNCVKAYVLSSSGFTSSATGFAENRPIELIGKEKLESILAKANV
ncbi:MAG: tetratricopeptide repeat protein [Treponema sp.]|nr:tetratricopeptide repeat protein [Treponema sp.]